MFLAICLLMRHMSLCPESRYDELALTYNDSSLLESMHARKCFETSLLPGCEIFKGLEKVRRFETVFGTVFDFFCTDVVLMDCFWCCFGTVFVLFL